MWKIYVQILTFQLQGGETPDPTPGALALDPAGGSAPDPRYRLALHALAICPRPLSPALFGVKLRPCSQPTGDISHETSGRLPLVSTRPLVTSQPNYTAWRQRYAAVSTVACPASIRTCDL